MSTTAEIQAYVRANTATAYSYEGDLHALCDLAGVPAGHLLERLGALLETLPQGVLALLQNGSVEELLPILAPFSPASLFANGEPGAWYDPSDLSTMYQDAAGTTPVTGVEQPVGLILDKSRGLGPELVTNGTFDTNINDWTSNQGQTPVWSAGRLRLSTQGNFGTSVLQAVSCVIGKSYALNFSYMTVSGDGFGPGLRISTSGVDYGASGQIYRSPSESPTAFVNRTAVFTATQATIYVYLIASGGHFATTTYEFDNISVREVPGNHATQATTTSRPTLQQDTSGKYYLSFDGVDDSLSTGSIDFSSTDKMTVLAGVRKLSDAGTAALFETSSSIINNNGTLFFGSPTSTNSYQFNSKGSSESIAGSGRGVYVAPITNVVAGISDISGDSVILRVNGNQVAQSTADQGTGNYGNFPLYIGRRGGTWMPFNGRLYGLIVRGAATDATQLEQTEQWINSKMGGIY